MSDHDENNPEVDWRRLSQYVAGEGSAAERATFEQWMLAYCPSSDELVPGLPDAAARGLDVPAIVFRSGESDPHHTRATSERVAELLPRAQLVEPPWGDREWNDRMGAAGDGVGIFSRWPLLADQLIEWSARLYRV